MDIQSLIQRKESSQEQERRIFIFRFITALTALFSILLFVLLAKLAPGSSWFVNTVLPWMKSQSASLRMLLLLGFVSGVALPVFCLSACCSLIVSSTWLKRWFHFDEIVAGAHTSHFRPYPIVPLPLLTLVMVPCIRLGFAVSGIQVPLEVLSPEAHQAQLKQIRRNSIVAGLFLFTIAISLAGIQIRSSLRSALEKMVANESGSLPRKITETLTLDSVSVNGKTIRYYFTIFETDPLKFQDAVKSAKGLAPSFVCGDPHMVEVLHESSSLNLLFKNRLGSPVFSVEMTPDSCRGFFTGRKPAE